MLNTLSIIKNGLSYGIICLIAYERPFLMIDRVLSIDKSKIVAIKNVTDNEDFFKGHFAGFPIMPGALMVEGMGQAGTLLLRYNIDNHFEKDVLAYKIKEAKFTTPAFPGDQLRYELTLLGQDERGGLMTAKAFVGDKQVAEAQMMLAVVDRKEFRGKASPVYK
jgi:3-hydroxymyristoyl/3-hydroxydecanoyl-(acyl carrier protein) dehydratase